MTVSITELDYDLEMEPYIIGEDQQKNFGKILSIVYSTRFIHDFVGDPGTGKSHMVKQIAKQYARMKTKERMRNPDWKSDPHCPIYYVTVDEEMTKTSLLAGKSFEKGDLKLVRACVGEAMYKGGCAIVDEYTHGMPNIQLNFNSVGDNESMTSIGDLTIMAHEDFRLLTSHNRTSSPRNSAIVTSTGSRMVCWPFDYPEALTETKIAKSILIDQIGKSNVKCPDAVLKYLVDWTREIRRETGNHLPVSARNVAAMGCLLSLEPRDTSKLTIDTKYDNAGTGTEPFRKKVAERIMFAPIQTDADLHHPQVNQFLLFLTQFGEEEFREVVKQCSMFYLDIEGITGSIAKTYRAIIENSII